MIRLWKMITLPGIVALLLTFSLSALLVTLFKSGQRLEVFPTGTEFSAKISQKVTMPIPAGLVRLQEHPPLIYTGMEVDKAHGLTSLIAKNISGREISAYCLAIRTTDKVTSSLWYESTTLRPNETISWENDLRRVHEIWIDFVEFTDGASWGPDEEGLKKRLDARREGAYIAASRYMRILHRDGPNAVLTAIPAPVIDPNHRGEEFNSGVEEVCQRLLWERDWTKIEDTSRPKAAYEAVLRDRFERILRSYTEFHRH